MTACVHRITWLGLAVVALTAGGCLAPKYKMVRQDSGPPLPVELRTQCPALEATLHGLIIFNGPGSWKRRAYWDEYILSLHNPSHQPLSVATVTLADYSGEAQLPGDHPWRLERRSKTLEQKYRDAGFAFVRNAAPAVVITYSGAGLVAASGGIFSAGAGTIMVGTAIAIPVYYVAVWAVNHQNKRAIEAEFDRRRIVLPLTLAAGETRTGSLFFPMVPDPSLLTVHTVVEGVPAEVVLELAALHGLHSKPGSTPDGADSTPAALSRKAAAVR